MMDEFQKNILLRNRVRLVDDLQPDVLVNYMIQDGIMTTNDSEMVDSKPTRMKKNEYFLDTLATRGPTAFHCFLAALSKMEDPLYHFLCEQYRNPSRQQHTGHPVQDNTDAPSPMDISRSFPTPVQEENQSNVFQIERFPATRITELQLNEFAGNMGAEWKSFMRTLNITENQIYHASSGAYSEREKIFNCLIKWRQREANNATVRALVQKCYEFDIDIDAYDFLAK